MYRAAEETPAKLMCLAGSPVSHSLSPFIHNTFAREAGLPYAYLAFDILKEQAEAFTGAVRLLKMAGCNVTMPLKEAVIPFLDDLDESAKRVGAVNTIVNRGDRLTGFNTDGAGFLRSLDGFELKPNAKAVILGNGGAAKSVAAALVNAGAEVFIAVRTPRNDIPGTSVVPWEHLKDVVSGVSLLVNATPLGMDGHPDTFENLGFLGGLSHGALVYDLIYAPGETALLREARAAGFKTSNGLPMLVYQAALAFSLITGQYPSENSIETLLSCLS